ncbi:phage Gp37/Gp68 family protein [Paracoccus onubensis]|uniref:Phage Gp37/Gp68 family protein n=1 Tax=Paracoccus onubensis TaxID=1675788 RepID=A0A418SZP3_9RHOB|nr:phage Gp37/Gp68 family protein [Paracoccus onubensis]RJE86409.1 phage Gp37/Gp68 family protein [Paracoccus onubensis]
MAENSKIEWTHHTFNPWIGCQKVGPGCDHCYAEAWDARGLQQRETRWGPHAARTRTSAANWRKPLAWDRAAAVAGERRRVFCASLADVFDNHASILPEWRADLWELIAQTPNLDWMLLTKRPGNIGNMLPVPFDFERLYPNVWLGCTVVNQEEADRDVPKLLAVPAAIRFLSMEPLLGPVDLRHWIGVEPVLPGASTHLSADGYERQDIGGGIIDGLDLVIVGGESGPGARPMHPEWVRSLRDQCYAAGVSFHFKQWGEWVTAKGLPGHLPIGHVFDDGYQMIRLGKKATGRQLDGRTWDEMPEVHHG